MKLSIDHIVLTTRNAEQCRRFYVEFLGMREVPHENHVSYHFDTYKINVHTYGHELEPKAHLPVPGSLDICFSSNLSIEEISARVAEFGLTIIEGPGQHAGANGTMTSVYLRDPDLNLIEICNYEGKDV